MNSRRALILGSAVGVLFLAGSLQGCVPPPLMIPPHLPDTDRPVNAAAVAGTTGVMSGPVERERSCFDTADGWHVKGSDCLPHVSGFLLHQWRIAGVGAVASAGAWGLYGGVLGRLAVVDRPHHRVALSAAALPLAGQLDLGYAYRITPAVALHVQAQGGLNGPPSSFTAYLPLGVTWRLHEHVFAFARMTPGVLATRGETFQMLLGTGGVGVTWGEATGRDVRRARTGELDSFDGADLRKAKFAKQDLVRESFRGATLREANFNGSELRSARFDNADLRGASFVSADLDRASLVGVDLRGASLASATLRGADLRGANVHGVSFDQADLTGADLSTAIGLTSRQIARACGDATTRLTPGFVVPACARDAAGKR